MPNYCPNCGTQLKGTENFCENCGASLISNTSNDTNREDQNKYAWALAVAPGAICWLIIKLLGTDYSIFAMVLAEVSALVLLLLDIEELKHRGYNTGGYILLGLLLRPLYLFTRAASTDKKYGYAITWCVIFVVCLLLTNTFAPVLYITAKIR